MTGPIHYRLHGPAIRLLNQLCHLGKGTLIFRQQGLSLARSTGFGLFVASGHEGWHRLRDAISGLEADFRLPCQAHLFADPDDGRPVFAMSRSGRGIDFSIRLESQSWDSPALQTLLETFHGISQDARDGGISGAGAWLDEWEQTSPWLGHIGWDIAAALDSCRCLEIELRSGMHRMNAAFRPSFLDTEGSVFRIADAAREHVVFADTAAPGFRWASLAPGHLRIGASVEEEAAGLVLPAA